MKTLKVVFLVCLMALLPMAAYAQNPCVAGGGNQGQLGRCVSQIYLWSLGVAGILGVFMGVIGGYLVITSAGNAERATRGKSYLYSSILGIVLLLGAYLILSAINPDLTNFTFQSLNCLRQRSNQPPVAGCP
ncbi:MAG TPA: hypothetical protein VD998_01890 [Verrucomicrobiae bacterium]|nr:hypothetical protein [Verrucomicrobiae bacterium]